MKLLVKRFGDLLDSTLGALYIDGEFCCFSLEDEKRLVKVPNETRIPAGEYEINLRTEGQVHQKYLGKFPGIHQGMLWLQSTPGFQWVYLHVGNTDDHTSGCILVGDTALAKGEIADSVTAYKRVYLRCVRALNIGEKLTIEVQDS